MDDIGLHAPAGVHSQLQDWFPRVIGERPLKARYLYEIFIRTRDGRLTRLHRSYDRQKAYSVYRAQHEAVGEMRDALTGDLVGTIGRGDFMPQVRALVRLAESVDLAEMQDQVVQTREGPARLRVNRRETLLKQAATFYAACNWPGQISRDDPVTYSRVLEPD